MFSVVIPAFNHRKFVDWAIMSSLRSPLVSEVLIVDDGSRDDTLDICRSYEALGTVRMLPNGGSNQGAHSRLNQLVDAAANDWVAVLNSDDEFASLRFELCQSIIREVCPDLIFGAIEIIDHDGRAIGYKRGSNDPEYSFPHYQFEGEPPDWLKLLNQNYIATTSNMIFKKSLWKCEGGFRDFRYVHDWDFALRAALRHRVHYCDTVLTRYRLHGDNTIKETPAAVDGEVTRMFCGLLAQDKTLLDDENSRISIVANKHIAPDTVLQVLEVSGALRRQSTSLGRKRLSIRALTEALVQLSAGRLLKGVRFGFDREETGRQVVLPRVTNGGEPICKASTFLADNEKPLVFILSGFFAVGGVERNTVEVVRHLAEEFRFVLITFEPHSLSVGSLHHQLEELGVPCIDFGHIPDIEGGFEGGLKRLKGALEPSAVWVINGSTWQSSHAGKIRGIFFDAVIVDQQVYDTKEGWITTFQQPGVLSADKFIAINKAIESHFLNVVKLPQSIVPQIYPCISLDRLEPVFEKRAVRNIIRERFGVPNNAKVVGFIGRLSEQKRPQRFVKLASMMASYSNLHFLMVGKGPLDDELKYLINNLGLQNITQVDYVEDISDIGAIIDCLTICSDYEGLPIVLLESVYMCVPFLSTAVGDIPDFASKFRGGVVVDNWDDTVTEQFFLSWIMDIDRAHATMTNQRNRLAEEFSARSLSERYRNCFKSRVMDK